MSAESRNAAATRQPTDRRAPARQRVASAARSNAPEVSHVLQETRCAYPAETQNTSRMISITCPKNSGDRDTPNRTGYFPNYTAPHDTIENALIRNGDPAPHPAVAGCGAARVSLARVQRRSDARTDLQPPPRDWHTAAASEAPVPISTDQQEGTNSGPPGPRPAVDAQRRNATLPNHASTFILRDAHAVRPQDGHGTCGRESKRALMLSSARSARPSKHERELTSLATSLSFRVKALCAADPEPRGSTRRHLIQRLGSGSRAARATGMTGLARLKAA
jgi:hypothetical protein